MFNIFPSGSRAFYEVMWKNNSRAGEATDDNTWVS